MTQDNLCRLLAEHPWQNRITVLDCVDSTNTVIKALAAQGAPHGTVVFAREQTGGKGRLGRQFSSPRDMGIYCSVLLRYRVPPERLMCLTAVAAEATRRALTGFTGPALKIKWTNDLVFEKKKLCGILTELAMSPDGLTDYVVLGIGINCNQLPSDFPAEVSPMATSLRQLLGGPADDCAVAAALLWQLLAASQALPDHTEAWMADYKTNCLTIGQDVKIVRGDRVQLAHVDDMTDQGALLVTLSDGTKELVLSGEVSVRGMYGYL